MLVKFKGLEVIIFINRAYEKDIRKRQNSLLLSVTRRNREFCLCYIFFIFKALHLKVY